MHPLHRARLKDRQQPSRAAFKAEMTTMKMGTLTVRIRRTRRPVTIPVLLRQELLPVREILVAGVVVGHADHADLVSSLKT